jgi:hypothetical protein
VIKKAIAIIVAAVVCLPVASAASITSVAKAKSKITPSPSPVWPPKGFIKSKDGNTYAKIPTAKELVGLASNDKVLTKSLAQKVDGTPICEKYSCGAVQVVSAIGCTWWVVTADIRGATSIEDKTLKTFGSVRTTWGETGTKKFVTVLIISKEPIELKHSVANIKATCRHDVPVEKVPGTTYTIKA